MIASIASPLFKARLAGLFQLLEALTAAGGEVLILGSLVVSGNAALTAANILGHESLFWFGFTLSVVAVPFHLAWALLLYDLLKPVNRIVSLFSMLVIVVGCAIQTVTGLFYLAPLLVLRGGSSLTAFTPQQLQSLAYIFVKLNSYAFDLYLVFFGFWCILIGYLIFKSTFLPRILGVLLAISGLGWSVYLLPPLAHQLLPIIDAASALGEIPVMVWLLVMGVNVPKWEAQANRNAS